MSNTGRIETKKYELVDPVQFEGRTLYRVKALKDFSDVKAGDVGGFVESELNLSHDGDCWIYNDAIAIKDTRICDNSCVKGLSIVVESLLGDSTTIDNSIVTYIQTIGNVTIEKNSSAERVCFNGNITIMDSQLKSSNLAAFDSSKTSVESSRLTDSELFVSGSSQLILRNSDAFGVEARVYDSECFCSSCILVKSRMDLTSSRTWMEVTTLKNSNIINVSASITTQDEVYITNSDIMPGAEHDVYVRNHVMINNSKLISGDFSLGKNSVISDSVVSSDVKCDDDWCYGLVIKHETLFLESPGPVIQCDLGDEPGSESDSLEES